MVQNQSVNLTSTLSQYHTRQKDPHRMSLTSFLWLFYQCKVAGSVVALFHHNNFHHVSPIFKFGGLPSRHKTIGWVNFKSFQRIFGKSAPHCSAGYSALCIKFPEFYPLTASAPFSTRNSVHYGRINGRNTVLCLSVVYFFSALQTSDRCEVQHRWSS